MTSYQSLVVEGIVYQLRIADETSRNTLRGIVRDLLEKRWDMHDIRAYCMCLEEVNPGIREDVAIRKMKAIAGKYANHR